MFCKKNFGERCCPAQFLDTNYGNLIFRHLIAKIKYANTERADCNR